MIKGAVATFSFLPAGEPSEIADDVRALFEDLAASLDHEQRAYSGECRPALDVRETQDAVEITMDAPGLPASAVRILFRAGVLLVVGEKAPARAPQNQSYHLVEREFGRFARAVKLAGAFDIASARAEIRQGELVIVLPKTPERRGRAHHIEVTAGAGPA